MSNTINELEFFKKRAFLSQEIEFAWPFKMDGDKMRALAEGEEPTLKIVSSRIPLQQINDAGLRASTHGAVGSDAYNNYFMHYLQEFLYHSLKDDGVKEAFNQMSSSERVAVLSSYLSAAQADKAEAEKNADT